MTNFCFFLLYSIIVSSESINGNIDIKESETLLRRRTASLLKLSTPFAVTKNDPMNYIFDYLNKQLHNSNITSTLIDIKLSILTIDGKLEIKYPLGKISYRVKGNNALESGKSKTLENNPKTPTYSPSLHSPLVYETLMIESNEDTVGDTNRCLEEKVNLLNMEVIAMKSFIEDQMVIVGQSRKVSTLQKSPCDHNSETARLTEEITDLRNKNRTKSCIVQTLLENDNTQEKPQAINKNDFIVQNKCVRSPKNNTIIFTSNRYQELSKNDDIENESNTGDYVKLTKAAESNKTGKRNNCDARKKSTNPVIHRHKKTQQHVQKYENVTVILGDSMVKDLTRT